MTIRYLYALGELSESRHVAGGDMMSFVFMSSNPKALRTHI